jgi:hypothetical protein
MSPLPAGVRSSLLFSLRPEGSPSHLIEIILPGFRIGPLVNFALYLPLLKGTEGFSPNPLSLFGSTGKLLNSSTTSVFLGQVRAHHFYIGVVFIIVRSILSLSSPMCHFKEKGFRQLDAQLSMNLAIGGSLSIAFAHHIYAIPIYPYLSHHYPTVLCLFYHHMWVGGFLIIGAGAHASIFIIGSKAAMLPLAFGSNRSKTKDRKKSPLCFHRDLIIGHLIWVSIGLGLHNFGFYIHNDTLQGLQRTEDIFVLGWFTGVQVHIRELVMVLLLGVNSLSSKCTN